MVSAISGGIIYFKFTSSWLVLKKKVVLKINFNFNLLANILCLTGGGGIILVVMVSDRYTAKIGSFWVLRMGVF